MRKGFTLVELSIVLVVIGLLIGGILVAQSMITTARNHSIIRDVEKYRIAIRLFKNQYGYLPGTNSGAKANWFRGPYTGDDSWVDGRRGFLMFSEMSNLGMLDQKYDASVFGNTYNVNPNPESWPGIGIPKLNNGASVYGISSANLDGTDLTTGLIYGTIPIVTTCKNYNFFRLSKYRGTTIPDYGPAFLYASGGINTINAKSIDTKVDDGNGSTGSILGEGATGDTSCKSGVLINGGDYNISSTINNTCLMYFCAETDN